MVSEEVQNRSQQLRLSFIPMTVYVQTNFHTYPNVHIKIKREGEIEESLSFPKFNKHSKHNYK